MSDKDTEHELIKTWYLQRNEANQEFWDTYLHQGCRSIETDRLPEGTTPYDKRDMAEVEWLI